MSKKLLVVSCVLVLIFVMAQYWPLELPWFRSTPLREDAAAFQFERWRTQATATWRGIRITPDELRVLEKLDAIDVEIAKSTGAEPVYIDGLESCCIPGPYYSGSGFEENTFRRFQILALDQLSFLKEKDEEGYRLRLALVENFDEMFRRGAEALTRLEANKGPTSSDALFQTCPEFAKALTLYGEVLKQKQTALLAEISRHDVLRSATFLTFLAAYRETGELPVRSPIDYYTEALKDARSQADELEALLDIYIQAVTSWNGSTCPAVITILNLPNDSQFENEPKTPSGIVDPTRPVTNL